MCIFLLTLQKGIQCSLVVVALLCVPWCYCLNHWSFKPQVWGGNIAVCIFVAESTADFFFKSVQFLIGCNELCITCILLKCTCVVSQHELLDQLKKKKTNMQCCPQPLPPWVAQVAQEQVIVFTFPHGAAYAVLSRTRSGPVSAAAAEARLPGLQTTNPLMWFAWATTGLTPRHFLLKMRPWYFHQPKHPV